MVDTLAYIHKTVQQMDLHLLLTVGSLCFETELNDSLCCTATSGLHCFAQQVNKTCETIRVLLAGLPYALQEQTLSHSQLLAELFLKNMSKVFSFNFALAFIHICFHFLYYLLKVNQPFGVARKHPYLDSWTTDVTMLPTDCSQWVTLVAANACLLSERKTKGPIKYILEPSSYISFCIYVISNSRHIKDLVLKKQTKRHKKCLVSL